MRLNPVLSVMLLVGCSAGAEKGSPGAQGDASVGPDVGWNIDGGEGAEGGVTSGPPANCKGLQCQQTKCAAGTTTTVTGTVYAPNGKLPLYNVIVYVPNSALKPLPSGAYCDKCGVVSSGDPVVTALTNEKGQFTLSNVPAGTDIPLVVQLGKWRRKIVIPQVTACVDTPVANGTVRLPKNQSEGDMPKIAVTTGNYDQVGCMLPKIGIDASEFGPPGSSAAVHFYTAGGTAGPPGMLDARALWNDPVQILKYDVAIFSCEGEENYKNSSNGSPTKDAASFKVVTDYLAAGGRIFTTDFMYTWYKYSPDTALSGSAKIPGGAPPDFAPGFAVKLDTTFPKGKALADWLKFVDPTTTYGSVAFDTLFANYSSVVATKVQTWATGTGKGPRVMTTNTPVGKPVEQQCGKAVHLDAHVNASDKVDATYPAGCASKIKPGEEAFAFFFFDLSSCIQNESDPPAPPPPIQ